MPTRPTAADFRRWQPKKPTCWCCRRTGVRPAIAAVVAARRVAWVCQACATSEALVREFATRQITTHQGESLMFHRLPFIRRTVFEIVFADYPRTVVEGTVIAHLPDQGPGD